MLKLKPDIYRLDNIRNKKDHQLFPPLEENIIHADTLLADIDTTFTVIVGNPPYVRHERLDKNYKKALLERYRIAVPTWDLYAYFILRAYELLEEGGVLGFIVSNKWLRADYGEPLRDFLARNVQIKEIRDYTGCKVFPSARVDPMTIIFQKSKPTEPYEFSFVKEKERVPIRVSSTVLSASPWILEREEVYQIKRKLEEVGEPLREWDVKIYFGIKTGYNDAFIIDTQTRNRILANCKDEEERKRTEEIIKPVLRGRDIERYRYKWAGLWIICTFPSKKIDIEQYPALKEYLASFGERLLQDGKPGHRKKTPHKWYETQDNIAYYPEFEKEKIVFNKTTKGDYAFAYDSQKCFVNQSTYIMVSERYNQKLLLGILNSQLFRFAYREFYAGGGIEGEITIFTLENFPLPSITKENQPLADQIVQKVQEILTLTQSPDFENSQEKQEKVKELEREIDQLVYKLYGLTQEEIRVVEEG